MAIFHFKTIHQILICGKILSKWESNVSQNCNSCNKEDDISHMLFTCVMVRNVWKDVSHILQCEIKLEHIILYHNDNYHSNIDNELINYCISEVAYSICKFWLKNLNNKIKETSLDLRNYIVSSIKYKAVLMTEIQTANENVRQCLEYLCEKLNNVGTKLHRTLYTTLDTIQYCNYLYLLLVASCKLVILFTVCLVYIVINIFFK